MSRSMRVIFFPSLPFRFPSCQVMLPIEITVAGEIFSTAYPSDATESTTVADRRGRSRAGSASTVESCAVPEVFDLNVQHFHEKLQAEQDRTESPG